MSVDVHRPTSTSAPCPAITAMEEEQDEFEDACEELTEAYIEDAHLYQPTGQDLESSLIDARKSINFFFNNQFDEARLTLKAFKDTSLYHSLGSSVFCFLEAMLTFQGKHIKAASAALKTCVNVCEQHRRKNTVYETIGKMVKRPNYNTYTAMELHAELCYAEALLLKSILTFVEDETLVTFLKAGLKIRSCFNSYKECAEILKNRDWTDDPHKVHFESGVRMGIGAFNLMISLLPARIIKLLEFIGFAGNKSFGLQELEQGFMLKTGLRQILCVMMLLAYNLLVVYVLSHTDGNLELCEKILGEQLAQYPRGVWFLFFKGRLEFMKGNLEEADKWYIQSWHSQNKWPHFHHLCFWELMFVHALRLDWRLANEYADSLVAKSRWSRTIYQYQQAAIMLMIDDLTPEENLKVEELMRTAPEYKQRLAGKSLPMEKFVIKKAERYFAQRKFLILPGVELVYMWNLFKTMKTKWSLAENIYKLVETTLQEFEQTKKYSSEFDADNRALLLLLKGALLHVMGSPLQAQQCLQKVIELEKQIQDDTHLVPYALVELAVIANYQGDKEHAVQLIETARKNYTGYSLESRLHFRMHSLMLELSAPKKDVEDALGNGNGNENGCYDTRL
ncbi:tetratricopeptide repeat protein 39B-like [Thrips palmi]|uniref:Tetratricopeptide repeat protein 39B-like n=1 Tax=Thrips palmi TaxID=161013 RepID=A0A6P8Z4H0_THRPL|nr:tetratricopeptide repeat protein 39B-like [Thrips palmi]